MPRLTQNIAVFDFDGTLIKQDSMLAFLKYVCGKKKFILGLCWLSPMLLGFKLGFIKQKDAKERLLTYFLSPKSEQELYRLGELFAQDILSKCLRPSVFNRLRWHQQAGHACYLLTASLTFWTRAWAEEYGLILIATWPEIKEGVFWGKIHGENCWGQEKVNRILALLSESKREALYIYAYGDSKGDEELLDWADEGYWV